MGDLRLPVYVNNGGGERKLLRGRVVKVNRRTVYVELTGKDGRPNIVCRRIDRDVPQQYRELLR